MDSQFWKNAWLEGRTAFHQQDYHDKLQKYFPQLMPQSGQRVLVPLCGKSKDMLWLHALRLDVHGIELHDQAVEAFFAENALSPVKKTQNPDFNQYTYENIIISCGDFFKFNENSAYDFIYDRAALVALPRPMRKNYAQVIMQSLKTGGKYLLISYEYDQTQLDGPPFSVNGDEIHELYHGHCTIKLMESTQPNTEGSRLSVLESLRENVYILEKMQ